MYLFFSRIFFTFRKKYYFYLFLSVFYKKTTIFCHLKQQKNFSPWSCRGKRIYKTYNVMRKIFREILLRDTRMEGRIIVTGSQTSAIKAKRLLEKSGIRARVVRPLSVSKDGCKFGIEITMQELPYALSVLGEVRISYSDIIKS